MPHPLFPRVVVYISKRNPSDFEIVVQAKSGYSYPWTTVVRERASTASKARGIAHLLGTAWEKRASAAGKYELVHGAPPAATRTHGNVRIAKTEMLWITQTYTGGQYRWEDVDTNKTWKEAKASVRSYRENQPEYAHRVIQRRVKIEAHASRRMTRRKRSV